MMYYCLLTPFQRLSVKTNLKLAKLWLDRGEYDRLKRVCKPKGLISLSDFSICEAPGRLASVNTARWRRGSICERNIATRDIRPRNSNVQRDQELQEAQGNLLCFWSSDICHFASKSGWCDQGMRRKDVDARKYVFWC